MRIDGARGRFLREESGFTLPELMTTMVVMLLVLFALYNLFDTGLRIFSFGNNKMEATENARVGLEKMEREIRAAYPVNVSDPTKLYLFFNANGSTTNPPQAMPTATQITFGNDLDGSGTVACGTPCEYITYKLTANDSTNTACTASPCTLKRVNAANSTGVGDPVVENVVYNGLSLTYYKADGTAATSEGQISRVRVSLEITVDPGTTNEGTQELTSEIYLRNRQ